MTNTNTNKERLYGIIKKPVFTDKVYRTNQKYGNIYAFEVAKDATKVEIAQAIELAYPNRKVKKVRTVYMPSHQKRMGMKFGRTQSGKKAIVTIVGDPIEELTGV